MDKDKILDSIGKEVYWEAKDVLADIVNYEKGWITIKTDDGEEHKVRAKAIKLMDTLDEIEENEDGEVEIKEADPSEDSSEAVSVREDGEFDCRCGETFRPKRTESFQCPACGRWYQVKLHPNLENYVKGMDQTASGRDTVDIDDHVATILRGMDIYKVYNKVCIELNNLDPKAMFSKAMDSKFRKSGLSCADFLQDRYGNLNLGMQRMNLGNLLRGAYKRDSELKQIEESKAKRTEASDPVDEVDPKFKEWVDNASMYDLLQKQRFAPIGDPGMMGANGEYFIKAFTEAKNNTDPAEFTAISKKIGWGK